MHRMETKKNRNTNSHHVQPGCMNRMNSMKYPNPVAVSQTGANTANTFSRCHASTEVITILSYSHSVHVTSFIDDFLMIRDDYLLAFSASVILQIKYLSNTGESDYLRIQVIRKT